MNEKIIRPYFEIDDQNAIFPSTGGKRFAAKLLDILLVSIIIFIIDITYTYTTLSGGFFDDNMNLTIEQWSSPLMIVTTISILVWITFLIVIPLLNFKEKGQSLGKMVFSITPMYLDKKNKEIKIILRELPYIILFASSNIMILITGYNVPAIISEFISSDIAGTTTMTVKELIGTIFTNSGNVGYVTTCYIATVWISFITLILLIFLFISITSNQQKRGYCDKMVNVAMVDLKTIIPLNEAEARFNQIINVNNQNTNYSNNVDINIQKDESVDVDVVDVKLSTNKDDFADSKEVQEWEEKNNNTSTTFEDNQNDESINIELNDNEDLNIYTIPQLKKMLEEKNIAYKSSMKKQELIDLLKNNK